MDHLPKIKFPQVARLKIPYMCEGNPYDHEGFSDFPDRQGWNIDTIMETQKLKRSDGSDPSQDEKDAFLQAWLFFGLIGEIFGIAGLTTKVDDFIVDRNGRTFLSTFLLPQYLNRWRQLENSLSKEVQKDHFERTLACIEQAASFAGKNFSSLNFALLDEKNPINILLERLPSRCSSPDLALCLVILGQTMYNMLGVIWEDESVPWVAFSSIQCQDSTIAPMKAAGWCPSEIRMLHSGIWNVTSLYLAGTLSRPNRETYHEACTLHTCLANQVDEKNYQTRHSVEGCECGFISADQAKVSSILRRGGIPAVIVSIPLRRSDKVAIEVVEPENYVAISHVWSHGLGNPIANALPECQLRRLGELMVFQYHERAYPKWHDADFPLVGSRFDPPLRFSVPFWLDTLCVPVQAEMKADRTLALAKMKDIYKKADRILVLDRELMTMTRQSSKYEKCLRILLSAWMRRLWTLQEAIIEREKLSFQFLEISIPFWDLYETAGLEPYLCDDGAWKALSARLVPSALIEPSSAQRFGRMATALQYRTTSKPADEAFCIGAILGLEVDEILHASSAEQRMKLLWIKIRHVSPRLIFLSGPRLQETNFTWAPSSFLTMNISISRALPKIGDAVAFCDRDGLHADYPGCFLVDTGHIQNQVAGALDTIIAEDSNNTIWLYRGIHHDKTVKNHLYEKLRKIARPAVIFNTDSAGAIVNVKESRDGTLYASYVYGIERAALEDATELFSSMGRPTFKCDEIPSDQKWCIQ